MTDGIFLLLGSNMGGQNSQLAKARRRLTGKGIHVLRASQIYRSAAWGPIPQPDFANQVVQIEGAPEPDALLRLILEIEIEMGRIREEKWGPRLIDIDILYYNQLIVETPDLNIPHPEISRRRFTLFPMAEIAPHFQHPSIKKSQALLLEQCLDTLEVTSWV